MAAEAAGRNDATAGPADCTEMEERVRGFLVVCDAISVWGNVQNQTALAAAGLDTLLQRDAEKHARFFTRSRA